MSRPQSAKRRKRQTGRQRPPASDLGPYVGFGLIWVFASLIIYLTARDFGPTASSALLCGFALYVAWCCARAYQGRRMARWQKGLVRLPLIVVGAPKVRVDEIRGQAPARRATFFAAGVAVLLLALTGYVAVRTL